MKNKAKRNLICNNSASVWHKQQNIYEVTIEKKDFLIRLISMICQHSCNVKKKKKNGKRAILFFIAYCYGIIRLKRFLNISSCGITI